jgi:aspartyl-tRNA(Asn)/glutamyl-tRNA(Gln) amidotransferase subunit B
MGETMRLLKEKSLDPDDLHFSPKNLAKLIQMVEDGVINGNVAKEVFGQIFEQDINPEKYVEEKGLKMDNNTDEIRKIVEEVVANNPQSVEDYRGGKEKALGFLVGQTMKAAKGKANPGIVNQLLKEILKNE